jgi:outer membrane protein OmpA-like peptidoglycan-associated protein
LTEGGPSRIRAASAVAVIATVLGTVAVLGMGAVPGMGAARASAAPTVSDDELARSVHDLAVGGAVTDVVLGRATIALRTEARSGAATTVTISSDVLFAFDSATLTPLAVTQVDALAARLRASSGPVRVDGYTDDVGSDAYNLGLSRRRADAVAASLRARAGGGPAVAALGHGSADPVAVNTTQTGRALNRRVTLTFAG